MNNTSKVWDTIIIGGGQSGLSVAYFMRRTKRDYLLLDDRPSTGGAWLNTWDSLRLFSPSRFSSLSGWQMPATEEEYPTKEEFLDYLHAYEKRYNFPIQRNTIVISVQKEGAQFKLESNKGTFYSKTLVSATGSAKNPFIPSYPNADQFQGTQLHSVDYRNPEAFRYQNVLIVGGGNSAAQILAEVSKVATTKWVTLEPPHFLPPDIDGRYLFDQANQKYFGKEDQASQKKISLAGIVQVDTVKDGLQRGIYQDVRPFSSFYEKGVIWPDGQQEAFDAVIWCTGFKADLRHLAPLHITENDKAATRHTQATDVPGLWLVGYGNWTGFASATIYGVGKTARQTAKEINAYLTP